MEISVGIKVAARGLEWDVTEVEPLGPQLRVRLACAGGDLQGLEWDVLVPAEPVTVLQTDPRPEDAGPLDDWRRYHTAWLLDQIPGAPAPPGRVAIEAYQRVPLLRALDMVRPRLLLADGVGLGKTIQAGLIAAELIVRRRAHRILVVCPPGPLLRQWEQEMRLRFGLRFTPITDSASLREARRGLELGGNPFDATALCLTSMDFAKSDRVLAELERVSWDLVIIDEAHHCAGGAGPGEDSQRRKLAEVLARSGDGLLLLTATPHDGHDPHFASLIALLDPTLVDGSGRLLGTAYRRHVVRRLKSHIRDPLTGAPLFRERVVVPVRVDVTDAPGVQAFHKALSALVAPRLRRSRDRNGLADALAFVSLLKRSMSSIAACVATLRVVAERYAGADTAASRRERQRALRAWRRRAQKFGVLDPAEEADIAALEAEEMAASLSGAETVSALRELIRLGEAAEADDPKLAALVLEVKLIRLQHKDANILVYTEYADSQRAAVSALRAIGGTILTISGSDAEAHRQRAAERCAEEDGIVLVSTDSLAEGLNLHQRCHHLIHLDLPYNPNRLEQRNGRIDRYGQRHDPEIRYLYLAGTFEERLLLRLIAKYEKARSCLSFMPNTLAVTAEPASLAEPLMAGFAEDLFSAMPRLVHSLDLAAEDGDSEAYRDLLREIDRAFQSFDHMAVRHGWMGSGPPVDAPPADEAAGFDLPAFVASVLSPGPDGYRVPPEWAAELDGLPGYDRDRGIVRLTDDPARTRDERGRTLLYPGRAHPLTRRAIALARTGRTGRVSAASGAALSLLITYAADIGCRSGTLLRRVFALQVFPDGSAGQQPEILALARDAVPPDGLWEARFAHWAPRAIDAANGHAAAVAELIAAAFSVQYEARLKRDRAMLDAWRVQRTNELCGPPIAKPRDLFDDGSAVRDWRSPAPAAERLAAFAADGCVPAEQRRQAAELLRSIQAEPPPLAKPAVRTLGLLMLVPAA
nr:helicase-related protein [uncultured Rhodopila sp.]